MPSADMTNETLKWIGVGVQLTGIGAALFGVGVVRAGLEKAADAVNEGKRGVARWWVLRNEGLRNRWRRLRGQPATMHRMAADAVSVSDAAVVISIRRSRVDPLSTPTRRWLKHVDDRAYGVQLQVDALEKTARLLHEDAARRVAEQREAVRAEIKAATTQGWEFVVFGLLCTAIGTVVGAFA